MISPSSLLLIDRLFYLPYRITEFVFEKFTRNHTPQGDQVIAIKLFGKGSLIHLVNLGRQLNSNMDNLLLITSDSQKDICEWMGLTNVIYIRTSNLWALLEDCWSAVRRVTIMQPKIVISLERCSYAVNTLGLLLSIKSVSKCVVFEPARNVSSTKLTVHPANTLSMENIFMKCLEQLPSRVAVNVKGKVPVDAQKIIVNINASELLSARKYSIDQYAEVIETLHRYNPRLQFLLTGAMSEREYVQRLVNKLKGDYVKNVAGEWSLVTLAEEMATAGLVLTGDSMPLHMAAFLEVPLVALWGPTQPGHFGYRSGKNIYSITLNLPCSPCFVHPASKHSKSCHGRIDCLMQLKPNQVAATCESLLKQTPNERLVNFPAENTKTEIN